MYTSGVVIVAKQKAMVVRLHEMFRQACLHATTLNHTHTWCVCVVCVCVSCVCVHSPISNPSSVVPHASRPTAGGRLVVLNLQSIVCHLLVLLQDSSGWPCSAFA